MRIRPLTLVMANDFVTKHHRHHGRVIGHRFSLGLFDNSRRLVGVCVVGRPVARGFDPNTVAEVTRLCVLNDVPNACSKLYSAAARVCREMGFDRIITYILGTETGVSLIGAGWNKVADIRGRTWSCSSRPRTDKHPTIDKTRWEKAFVS